MSEQKVWPSRDLADNILGDLDVIRTEIAQKVYAARGEDNKPVQQALLAVAWRLDELREQLQERLGVPAVAPSVFSDAPPIELPVVEPGQVTADALRRMRKNAGPKHRATP
jgi:hypothetical protein